MSVVRGYGIGLVRQAGSTIGFVVGLLLGSFVANQFITHVGTQLNRSIVSLAVVLGLSFAFMTAGEYLGFRMKERLTLRRINIVDGGFGSLMSAATLLFGIWLAANILVLSTNTGVQQLIRQSRIVSKLNQALPPATKVIGALNHLIDPNSFPQVFTGLEPNPKSHNIPETLGPLRPAVLSTQKSVVKVEGIGCGGIVEGSGFVLSRDKIVTNAHVIAGVSSPVVLDSNGTHDTRVVWFDPYVDLAVLQTTNLAGEPLVLNTTEQPTNTLSAVVGYPNGGGFTAQPATILDRFAAIGRNIYGQGVTTREVYSLAARVVPGNSGGPLIDANGHVLGIVFATSTTYNDVGYALTAHQVNNELTQAARSTETVGTGACSE